MENRESGLLYHVVLAMEPHETIVPNLIKIALPDYLAIKSKTLGCETIRVGTHDDHLHFVISIPPSLSIVDIIRAIKESSINYLEKNITDIKFHWLDEFYISTISFDDLAIITAQFDGQAEFHGRKNLTEETVHFLKIK
jgi:putative transposase